jgi:hypothetical protein
VLRGEWPKAPSGKKVTIEDTVSLDEALETIAEAAGWNVVLNTSRTGNSLLVLKLRDVPVEEAARSALAGTGLVATREGNTVVVAFPGADLAEDRPVLAGMDRPSGKRFNGSFEETPSRDALSQIAEAAGLSIVLPPGAGSPVNGTFRNTPVEDALRAVLEQAGLTAELRNGLLTVRDEDPLAALRRLPGMGGEIGREAQRAAQEAMRDARRELRRAQRELRDLPGSGDPENDRVASGDLVVSAGQQARDVVALRGDVKVEGGAQARNVVAVLGRVTIDGGASVEEVTAIGGNVEVGPGATVAGNATSVGGKVVVDPAGTVVGEQHSIGVPQLTGLTRIAGSEFLFGEPQNPFLLAAQVIAKFLMYFALGLVLLALFPRRLDTVAAAMTAHPWKSVLTGLLGTVAMPVLALLLVVTVIGILLVPVQAVAVMAAGVLGYTALAFYIGRSLPVRVQRGTTILQLAIGTGIVVLVMELPLIGILVSITAWLLVFGAVLRSRFGSQGPALPTTVVPPAATEPA